MNAVITGLLIPFIGTSAGAACVFFLKKDLKRSVQRALTGFAAGVMVAASIWSLIVPAIEQSNAMGKLAFLPAFIGFWLGILFLLLLDHVIPHLHRSIDQAEGPKSRLSRTAMMVLAVTLHNIPEGMAVGVVYAALLRSDRCGHIPFRMVVPERQTGCGRYIRREVMASKWFQSICDLFLHIRLSCATLLERHQQNRRMKDAFGPTPSRSRDCRIRAERMRVHQKLRCRIPHTSCAKLQLR